MAIIRCTEKLRKSLGITFDAVSGVRSGDDPLEEWYANVFTFERKKHVIATNARTLYSVVVHQVLKRDKEPLKSRISKALSEAMYYAGYSEAEIAQAKAVFERVSYAKTNDRRVLGSMNEFLIHYTNYWAEHPDQLQDALKIIHEIPMTLLNHRYPREAFEEAVRGVRVKKEAGRF